MIIWQVKSFEELSVTELYQVLKLRIQVFMLEQNCLYEECDDEDYTASHLLGFSDSEVVAYARSLPPTPFCSSASIGRVLIKERFRKKGLGSALMTKAIEITQQHFPDYEIYINAQQHLQDFYGSLGFVTSSETYLEDNIPHIRMKYLETVTNCDV